MSAEEITFEELDREHRLDRARDAERLRTGETSPTKLQAENSLLPDNARVRIPDLIAYARKTYQQR